MGVAIVEEWSFDSAPEEVLVEAERYAEYLKHQCPWVQLSLLLQSRETPTRLVMVRVFDRYSDYLHDAELTESASFHRLLAAHGDGRSRPAEEYDVCQSTGGTAKEVARLGGAEWACRITTWRLPHDGETVEPMRAIAEYMRSLKRRRHSAVFSLWLRQRRDPLRFLHVSTFKRQASLELEATSEAMRRLEQRLRPHVVGGHAESNFTGIVAVGGPTSLPRVALGRGWRPGRAGAQLSSIENQRA